MVRVRTTFTKKLTASKCGQHAGCMLPVCMQHVSPGKFQNTLAHAPRTFWTLSIELVSMTDVAVVGVPRRHRGLFGDRGRLRRLWGLGSRGALAGREDRGEEEKRDDDETAHH